MSKISFAAKAGFVALSILGTASLVAAPAHADSASASGAATVTSPSSRTVTVSAEVVSPGADFSGVTVTPIFTTDVTDGFATGITSLQVTPTVGGNADIATSVIDSVYGNTNLGAGFSEEDKLAILRSLVSGGALD